MTTRTASSFRKLVASVMIAGALALPASLISAEGSGHGTDVASNAPQSSPDILHHWPSVTVADANPAILHHWPSAAMTVADINPAILHHWPSMTVADADPAILHHWPSATTTVADIDPEILHHWA